MDSENNSVTLTNAITFAFMAKHLLPKSKVESINAILRRVLTEEISPKEMMKGISTILENEQTVNMVWRTLIDRKGIRMSPLYNEISQLIDLFLQADIPQPIIISFLYTILGAVKYGMTKANLVNKILTFRFLTQYKGITMPFLVNFAMRIASRIKPVRKPKTQPKIENIHDLVMPPKPDEKPYLESLPVKNQQPLRLPGQSSSVAGQNQGSSSNDKDNNQQMNESESSDEEEEEESLGFSYVKSDFYITKSPITMILNTFAKSTMNGAEGATDEKMTHFDRYLNYIKCYAHAVFEDFVKADISYFAILRLMLESYDIDNSIILINAVEGLYESQAPEIFEYIQKTHDISFIKERSKQMLYAYYNYRYRVSEITSFFSDVLPIFDCITSKKFSQQKDKTVFYFDAYKTNSSYLLSEIARRYLPKLDQFLKEVVKQFTCEEDEISVVICNDAMASAMFFYSRTCESINSILEPSMEGEMSLDAIIESAVFSVESKYDNVIRTETEELIISFVQKFFRSGEDFHIFQLFREHIQRLGSKSTLFFRMIANLVKLLAIVERVLVDRNYPRFKKAAEILGICKGEDRKNRIAARLPFMRQYIEPHFLGKLIMMEMDGKTKEMTIYPSF